MGDASLELESDGPTAIDLVRQQDAAGLEVSRTSIVWPFCRKDAARTAKGPVNGNEEMTQFKLHSLDLLTLSIIVNRGKAI